MIQSSSQLDPLRKQPTEDHQDVSRRETYYQLCMHTHSAVLAFATLRARVKIVSKQFDDDYVSRYTLLAGRE